MGVACSFCLVGSGFVEVGWWLAAMIPFGLLLFLAALAN